MDDRTASKIRSLGLAVAYPVSGGLPAKVQKGMANGFSPTVASVVSGTFEFFFGFSLFFMLLNRVFTSSFVLTSGALQVAVLGFLIFLMAEGLYRVFSIILEKTDSMGSVLYWVLHEPAKTVSRLAKTFAEGIPEKPTDGEKKQKEIADNFKKFIDYGMDRASLSWGRQ